MPHGPTRSMTGYANATGAHDVWSWTWDLRAVNGKGLDIRLRLPDWINGLETGVRGRLQAAMARGNVTCALRLERTAAGGLDREALQAAIRQIAAIEDMAAEMGHALTPMRAIDLIGMRGAPSKLDATAEAALCDALLAQFDAEVLVAFIASRAAEGQALDAILMQQVDRIADLCARAATAAHERAAGQGDALRAAIARISPEVQMDPQRLAQELALLAVRQDVTEELDRLNAHVGAAKTLVRGDGPKGRKLDFLMQEFNREANTLCAKSQDTGLTAIGLDLKTAIDQLREQVQNVE